SDLERGPESFYDGATFPRHWDTAACYEVLQYSDFGFVHQVLTFTRRPSEARTTLSARLNSYLVENLSMLKKYGPIFLNPDEYRASFASNMRAYYRFLLKSCFLIWDRNFWTYHRAALHNQHRDLNLLTVLMFVLSALITPFLDGVKRLG